MFTCRGFSTLLIIIIVMLVGIGGVIVSKVVVTNKATTSEETKSSKFPPENQSDSKKVILDLKNTYFTLAGSTLAELQQNLEQRGSTLETGQKGVAHCSAAFEYQPKGKKINNQCTLDPMTPLYVNIVCNYPKWDPPSGIAQEVIERWNSFDEASKTHEGGHIKIIKAGADKLYFEKIQKLRDSMDCDELTLTVKKLIREATESIDKEQAQYDLETKHGETQGVWLFKP